MKITTKNYREVPEVEQNLLLSLIWDLADFNRDNNDSLYIDWQDYHNDYSPERTDPCPDFYGWYRLRRDNDTLGEVMDIDQLDSVICVLSDYCKENGKK